MFNNKPDYDKVIEDFKRMSSGRIRRQIRNVLKLLNLQQKETILEVGVATGKFTSFMTKHNSCFALDISHKNLIKAKSVVIERGNVMNLFCVAGTCAAIPFAAESFDKITAIDIIEHVNDKTFLEFCREAHRVLKKGGSFFIYTPNLLHPFELSRPLRPVIRAEHIGVRNRRKICSFLKEENFLIRKNYFDNCFRRISIEAVK